MSTWPSWASAAATIRSHAAAWRRSATSARMRSAHGVPAISCSISATSVSICPTARTRCPSCASPSAIALPRPRKPPVTIALRCSISFSPEESFTAEDATDPQCMQRSCRGHPPRILRDLCGEMFDFYLHLGERHWVVGEARHDLLGEGAQAGDRGARCGEQYIFDTTRLETL